MTKVSYTELKLFALFIKQFLKTCKRELPIREILKNTLKEISPLIEGYEIKMEKIRLKYVATHPEFKTVLRTNGTYDYTPANKDKCSEELRTLGKETVEVELGYTSEHLKGIENLDEKEYLEDILKLQ